MNASSKRTEKLNGKLTRVRLVASLFLLGGSVFLLDQTGAGPSNATSSLEAKGPELKRAVALFRHGVRAPLKEIDDPNDPKKHASDPWPSPPSQWGAAKWGYLTQHGRELARALGREYAKTYKKEWPAGFKSFFWADVDERTRETANGLAAGFRDDKVNAIVNSGGTDPDPLFHSFQAHCGIPDPKELNTIAKKISDNARGWIELKYAKQFAELYGVLACTDSIKCEPLKTVTDKAGVCVSPSLSSGCSAPIKWQGQFPYANTASETFLLEYANQMEVGWGRVLPSSTDDTTKLLSMMALHDFYFEQTQRETYLAKIGASNLLREIAETLNGKKRSCRRIPDDCQFGALVGHDTNIASVASLLNLRWRFDDVPGTNGLPDNDPLPAGALVFELWSEGTDSFVRILYVTQSLRDMRTFNSESCPVFRVPVQCDQYTVEKNACKIPLKIFNEAIALSGLIDPTFLSRCKDREQVCGDQ